MSRPGSRRRVLALAWWPSVRGMDVRTVIAAIVLALAPALIVVLRGGKDFDGPLLIATIVLGGAVALAIEDPAEETLAGSPTARVWRRLIRLSAIAVGAALVLAAIVGIASATGEVTAVAVGRRMLELAAVAGLSAGIASAAQRAGLPAAAHGGAIGGAMIVLVISAFAYRYRWLPTVNGAFHHDRWWWVVAVGGVLTAWTWRDPARR